MGNAGFVSHQWVAVTHPDPELKQMQVLQEVLRHLLQGNGHVSLDYVTEAGVPSAKSISCEAFQAKPLFLWYDYFSVPQLEQSYWEEHRAIADEQAKAVSTIPCYVAKCLFFFALCPTIESHFKGEVLNTRTWAQRGWCRLERASRELSENSNWILIQSAARLEVVGTGLSLVTGSVGEGEFSVESDRAKLAPVMKAIVRRKLLLSVKNNDLPAYRRHLNLQQVHLRGLDVEPIHDLASESNEVSSFLRQIGFKRLSGKDESGWRPLHYAALSGNPLLIKNLLAHRADPNRRTSRDEPQLGFSMWVSALDLAIFYKHNEAARVLIGARAHPGPSLSALKCFFILTLCL